MIENKKKNKKKSKKKSKKKGHCKYKRPFLSLSFTSDLIRSFLCIRAAGSR